MKKAHEDHKTIPPDRVKFVLTQIKTYLKNASVDQNISDTIVATVEDITDYLEGLGDGAY